MVESLNHCVAKRRASQKESGVIREMPGLVNSMLKTREKHARFQIGIRSQLALRSECRFGILALVQGATAKHFALKLVHSTPKPREGNAMRQRKSDHPAAMHERLARKHTDLSDRVANLDGRIHLTASDQAELTALKREKLAMKDALMALEREL